MASPAKVLEFEKSRREYGSGNITKRPNGRYQIQYYEVQGRRRRETYKTEDRARKMLAKRLAQQDAGTLESADSSRMKIDILAESYQLYAKNCAPKSYSWIELVWRVHLEPFFGGKSAARFTSDDLQQYIDARLSTGAKTSTVNRELQVLKAMFYHGYNADPPKVSRVPRFPKRLAEPKARAGFINDEQYEAIKQHCPRALRPLIAIAYTFGFRKGELLKLRVMQVDLKARTISLLPGETKSGQGRTIKMTAEVFELVSECVKDKKPNDVLFTWPSGKPIIDFRGAWKAMTKKAGLPGLLVHDFRRSAVRNLIRAGVSRDVARKISGHETDSIFSRYNITDERDLAEAATKLEAARGKQ